MHQIQTLSVNINRIFHHAEYWDSLLSGQQEINKSPRHKIPEDQCIRTIESLQLSFPSPLPGPRPTVLPYFSVKDFDSTGNHKTSTSIPSNSSSSTPFQSPASNPQHFLPPHLNPKDAIPLLPHHPSLSPHPHRPPLHRSPCHPRRTPSPLGFRSSRGLRLRLRVRAITSTACPGTLTAGCYRGIPAGLQTCGE